MPASDRRMPKLVTSVQRKTINRVFPTLGNVAISLAKETWYDLSPYHKSHLTSCKSVISLEATRKKACAETPRAGRTLPCSCAAAASAVQPPAGREEAAAGAPEQRGSQTPPPLPGTRGLTSARRRSALPGTRRPALPSARSSAPAPQELPGDPGLSPGPGATPRGDALPAGLTSHSPCLAGGRGRAGAAP